MKSILLRKEKRTDKNAILDIFENFGKEKLDKKQLAKLKGGEGEEDSDISFG